jgi:hypothetical protein
VVSEGYQIGSLVSEGAIWESLTFTPQRTVFKIEFDVVPGANSLVGLSDGPAESWSDVAAIVRFAPEGKVDARSGSVYKAEADLNYTTGTTYRVLIDIDLASKSYSADVTPIGGATMRIAENYQFRTEQLSVAKLDNLSIWTNNGIMAVSGIDLAIDAARYIQAPKHPRTPQQ